ncbi:MAG: hypothetical protein CL458_03895 [Acidimicrobiaceae bacterium]|nr:hypothetical protein [Acidimicrobiaceae bacterium]|tara:strand:- start:19829 stop:20548 length:720 start_codon:yes stop_codon:yes gene_type:complete
MSIADYLLALIFLAVGGGVQATLGIGAGLVAGPALTVIEPELLPGPMLAMAMVVNVRNAVADRQSTHVLAWKRALLGAPLGLGLGAVVLSFTNVKTLSLLVSFFVLGAVALQLSGLKPPSGTISEYIAGTATAFSSTVAALPGPMFVVFHGHRAPGTVRGTLASFMLLVTPAILLFLAIDGRFGFRQFVLAVALAPGMFLGLLLGKALRPRISVDRFRVIILSVASLSAVAVIIRTIAT